MRDQFPFFNCPDEELKESNNTHNVKKSSKPLSMSEKLKLLIKARNSAWYNEMQPDEEDIEEGLLSSIANFSYYEANEFSKLTSTWDKDKSLSLFHTNIQGLENNCSKMQDLLLDLNWRQFERQSNIR